MSLTLQGCVQAKDLRQYLLLRGGTGSGHCWESVGSRSLLFFWKLSSSRSYPYLVTTSPTPSNVQSHFHPSTKGTAADLSLERNAVGLETFNSWLFFDTTDDLPPIVVLLAKSKFLTLGLPPFGASWPYVGVFPGGFSNRLFSED
jgi:hypothetical protein